MMKQHFFFLLSVFSVIVLSGCGTTGQLIKPQKANYGLSTYSSYDGDPLIITSDTPALNYKGRIYYFQDKTSIDDFLDNPNKYIAKYKFNGTPVIIPPLPDDYGLKTNCSYDGLPIVVTEYTPTLRYLDRIYYFAHRKPRDLFIQDPQVYVAKFPANKPPSIISPLKADYGTKVYCASTGTPLLVGPHTPTLEYMGRVFYFSSLTGMQQFKEDPQAYVAKKFNTE